MAKTVFPADFKLCRPCGRTLPLSAFNENRKYKRRHYRCRDCENTYQREWRRANRDKAAVYFERWASKNKGYKQRQRYGITQAEIDQRFEAQGGRCLVCGRDDPLEVDHDHDTNKVRGLLCHACNIGLGSFRDDPVALRAAANYLETF